MKSYTESARDIAVTKQTEVLVVGGGPAGVAAAIAAARTGARTLLIERFGYLGGTATASLMACINGFRNQVEPDSTQTVRGLCEEIVLWLKSHDGLGRSPYPQKSYPTVPGKLEYSYAIDVELFKYIVLKLCVDAGVEVMLHTLCSGAIVEENALRGILVENKSGRQAYRCRIAIDASGDADLAAQAGVPFRQETTGGLKNGLMYRISYGAARPKDLHACDFSTTAVVWGPASEPFDGTDADQLSRGEVAARLKVYEDFSRKKAKHPELADARLLETPPLLGIRQTRFIEGEYRLTAEDAIAGKRFDDVVAISSCPIIHYYGYRRYLTHEGYDIPYRCLLPKGMSDLLVAGRCISSEQPPYESHRAMVPIMAIGQAAGTAAALCVRGNTSPGALDVALLQKELRRQGAFLWP
jgi:hypothetical protein